MINYKKRSYTHTIIMIRMMMMMMVMMMMMMMMMIINLGEPHFGEEQIFNEAQ